MNSSLAYLEKLKEIKKKFLKSNQHIKKKSWLEDVVILGCTPKKLFSVNPFFI